MKQILLEKLLAARLDKINATLVTNLHSGKQLLLVRNEQIGDLKLSPVLINKISQMGLRNGNKTILIDNKSNERLFVHFHIPPKRLFIIGAVHVSQSLAPMAALAGYDVTIIDPRATFATEQRFPGVSLAIGWPDEVLDNLALDQWSAVTALTHDPKLDDPALLTALASEAFYIGALGSQKTHSKRLERLRTCGYGENELARIHGPIGLSIGSISPAEIAISILGEMTQVLRLPE